MDNDFELQTSETDFKAEIDEFVSSYFHQVAYVNSGIGTLQSQVNNSTEVLHFPEVDVTGNDKNVDIYEMNPSLISTYFEGLQFIHDYGDYQREHFNNKRPMYVGRIKYWQVLPDFYGKEQVDKVQAAIGAPLQEQLDEWDRENEAKVLEFPINNETIHKFRDAIDHHENIDQDYERIVYERQKNQKFEELRNNRYWETNTHNHDSHHH